MSTLDTGAGDLTTTVVVERRVASPVDRLTRISLVVGPLLLVGSTIAYAAGDGMGDDKIGGAVQVWAMIVLGVGLIGLAREVESRRPGVAAALTAVTLAGVCAGAEFGIDSIWTDVTGLSIDDEAVSGPSLFLPGLLFPGALLAHAATRFRLGLGAKLPAFLLAIGAALFPLSRIPSVDALAVIGDLFIVPGLVGLATTSPAPTRYQPAA